MNSQQTNKPQEMVKISNSQFYGGSVRTVKQRAHKFNAIAINNINNASSIPVPRKLIGNGASRVNSKNIENVKKSVNIEPLSSNLDHNHNIKINIVNKYTTTKTTTHVAGKTIEQDKNASKVIHPKCELKTDINHNTINSNVNGSSNTSKVMLNTGDVKVKINQLNQTNIASVSPSKSASPSWNASGWIRIYCGPDRSEFSCEDPNRMVMVYANSSTIEIVKDMGLPADYTLWVQIGGEKSRRLDETEHPLLVQEEFLKKLGYSDESRRSRLGIDPDLKYLIRFHIGPIDILLCRGATKCGNVELLKGLVFPQWQRRTIAIIGTRLIIYPANLGLMPETYELSGSEIFEHTPVYNRLIIKIVPKISDSLNNTTENLSRNKSVECLNSNSSSANSNLSSSLGLNSSNIHNSNLSVCSHGTTADREVVLFLGFEDSWERDLWSSWLMEVNLKHFFGAIREWGNFSATFWRIRSTAFASQIDVNLMRNGFQVSIVQRTPCESGNFQVELNGKSDEFSAKFLRNCYANDPSKDDELETSD